MASFLLSALTIILSSLMTSCEVDVPVSTHWDGGFQGKACIPITEELTHWTMHLRFDQPLVQLEVWSADIASTSADNTTYILTNKAWNGVEHVGDTVCMNFLGRGVGDIAPKITASIEEISGGDSSTVKPTQVQVVTTQGSPVTYAPGESTSVPVTQAPGMSTSVPVTQAPGLSTSVLVTQAPGLSTSVPVTQAPGVSTSVPETQAPGLSTSVPVTQAPGLSTSVPVTQAPGLSTSVPVTQAPGVSTSVPVTQASGLSTSVPVTQTPAEASTGDGYPGTLSVKQDWGIRFEGEIDFLVKENIEGWMANITFSTPVTNMNIFNGDTFAHSQDGLNWIVVNKQDRPFYKAGDTIAMRFFGNYNGSAGAPSATAVLYNLGVDKNWTVTSPPDATGSKYNYDELLMKSIMFYEAQRSGKLPANNRIPWRGDSALGDKGDNGEDLTGGWYDAGDHVKFNFPMAYTSVILSWGLMEFKDAYQAAGQLQWVKDSIRWPLEYLVKCHVAENELYVQVGDGARDHSYWGRPEEMTMPRPAYKIDASTPGCDVAMETAAAFAAGAMVFNETDKIFSNSLLAHARTLWQFALDHKGKYSDSVPAAKAFYPSFNYTDEMCWGSMWLYKATGEDMYLTEAKKWFDPAADWAMSWDDKVVACQLLLFEATGEDVYKQAVIGTFTDWFPGGSITYTPKGLAWRLQWAPLRYSSNMAMMALLAAKEGIHTEEYRHWAMCQIHYAVGDTGFSYVVGFGDSFPHMAHHRGASCPNPPAPCGPQIMSSNEPNVHVLYGALVGGPDNGDMYKDERSNYVMNEVACDYNSGFQTAVAGLRSLLIAGEHPEQTGNATCPYTSA